MRPDHSPLSGTARRCSDTRALADGGLEVEFQVLAPHWLAHHILQYGADAEVIDPSAVRALMRRLLAV
jgi:predicted DNA-binding transcriptional regulator YafY